jgi:proteasome accessory factor B
MPGLRGGICCVGASTPSAEQFHHHGPGARTPPAGQIDGYSDLSTSVSSRRRRLARDLQELETLGLKVLREDVGEGRFRYILDRASCLMPRLNLSPEDRTLLFRIGAAMSDAQQGVMQRHLHAALIKLQADSDLPPDMPRPPVRQSMPRNAAESSRLDVIIEALLEHRRVTFRYRSGDNPPAERTVAPWSLVARSNAWYLLAYDGSRKAVRTFRLSRMSGKVRITDPEGPVPEFEVPADFNPEDTFSSDVFGRGDGAFQDVRVRFAPEIAFIIENEFESVYQTKALKDGGLELRIPQAYPDGLLRFLGEFAGFWEITGPAALRKLVVERLRQAAKANP